MDWRAVYRTRGAGIRRRTRDSLNSKMEENNESLSVLLHHSAHHHHRCNVAGELTITKIFLLNFHLLPTNHSPAQLQRLQWLQNARVLIQNTSGNNWSSLQSSSVCPGGLSPVSAHSFLHSLRNCNPFVQSSGETTRFILCLLYSWRYIWVNYSLNHITLPSLQRPPLQLWLVPGSGMLQCLVLLCCSCGSLWFVKSDHLKKLVKHHKLVNNNWFCTQFEVLREFPWK